MEIELTTQEIAIITNALNAYWHEANEKLRTPDKLGIIEKSLLEKSKELTLPILIKFENF